ncbi:MAG TPA: fibronectin type III domain-containing protein [Polyangiaceae bacterium]|jgi:hypothetical protein
MTTSNQTPHRITVSLDFPRKVADFLLYANNIVQKSTNNPALPNPTPTMAVLTAAITDLHTSETAALSRATGAVTVRNEKRLVLVGLIQQFRGYVQGVADATPENAASIIQSAGFAVRKPPVRKPRVFEAVNAANSGTATVHAPSAGVRSAYDWEYSPDGGKTWVAAPGTIQAKTTVTGLPSGTSVQFRYRATTPKGGQGDWSPPVQLLVK